MDWCWQAYLDEPRRERSLTQEEQRSYEKAFRTPPRTTDKAEGEWAGLVVRAVG